MAWLGKICCCKLFGTVPLRWLPSTATDHLSLDRTDPACRIVGDSNRILCSTALGMYGYDEPRWQTAVALKNVRAAGRNSYVRTLAAIYRFLELSTWSWSVVRLEKSSGCARAALLHMTPGVYKNLDCHLSRFVSTRSCASRSHAQKSSLLFSRRPWSIDRKANGRNLRSCELHQVRIQLLRWKGRECKGSMNILELHRHF